MCLWPAKQDAEKSWDSCKHAFQWLQVRQFEFSRYLKSCCWVLADKPAKAVPQTPAGLSARTQQQDLVSVLGEITSPSERFLCFSFADTLPKERKWATKPEYYSTSYEPHTSSFCPMWCAVPFLTQHLQPRPLLCPISVQCFIHYHHFHPRLYHPLPHSHYLPPRLVNLTVSPRAGQQPTDTSRRPLCCWKRGTVTANEPDCHPGRIKRSRACIRLIFVLIRSNN